ncbi:hypothetical protein BC831DRAFT_377091, partial [Entophlyctis helioformis]
TGGRGAVGVSGGKPVAVDPFFSQGPIQVGDGMVFAVNAGSNTLSLFSIDSTNPTHLKRVGKPQNTLGEFPVSVTYSSKLKTACVLNGGAVSGIACFAADPRTGLRLLQDASGKPFKLRTLAGLNQTTPPEGPLGTASHIFFNPAGDAVHATVKSNPATKSAGFLATLPVDMAASNASAAGCTGMGVRFADKPILTSPNGTIALFGSAFADAAGTKLVATDAGFGIAFLDVPKAASLGEAKPSSLTAIDGQKATCWVAFSKASQTAFVTDVARGRIVEASPKTGKVVAVHDFEGPAKGNLTGMIDLTVGGEFVYALAPGQGALLAARIAGGAATPDTAATMQMITGIANGASAGMAVL